MSEDKHCADLAEQAKEGCEDAFADLVRLFAPRIHRFLCTKGLSTHDAEDLTQETFVKAYQAINRFDPQYAFSTWIFTIARRLAISHFRARKKHVPIEEHDKVTDEAPEVCDDQAVNLWHEAKKHLSEREYEALWLRYAEDVPAEEIGRALGITAVHARVVMHRARARLAEHMKTLPVTAEGRGGGE